MTTIVDLFHYYGGDLQLSPTGGLALASGASLTDQTVVRFVLTNPGDDPFNPTWGLGAAKMVGQVEAVVQVQALVLAGLKTLSIIDQTQPITVSASLDDVGDLNVSMQYIDAGTGLTIGRSIAIS